MQQVADKMNFQDPVQKYAECHSWDMSNSNATNYHEIKVGILDNTCFKDNVPTFEILVGWILRLGLNFWVIMSPSMVGNVILPIDLYWLRFQCGTCYGFSWSWWGKKGNLVMRFVGNFTIWREILTFDIKKYIRNGGKCNYIPRKDAFFQTLLLIGRRVTGCSRFRTGILLCYAIYMVCLARLRSFISSVILPSSLRGRLQGRSYWRSSGLSNLRLWYA